METVIPARRPRTCRACGKKFEYPAKDSDATRHHCENCVNIAPEETRKALERLSSRATQLENQLKALQAKPRRGGGGGPVGGGGGGDGLAVILIEFWGRKGGGGGGVSGKSSYLLIFAVNRLRSCWPRR